jgi:endonuclease/exonuclease/phosphatase (EEP) superfamily protein YafD
MQQAMDVIRAVALTIAAVSALAAILSLGGAFNIYLDILTHLAPAWLAMALLAITLQALAGLGGARAAMGLSAVSIVICVALMAPELIARLTAPRFAAGGQTIKIIQFNVWDQNRDPAATARWILDQDADIVVLEEAGGGVLARVAPGYPYQTKCDKAAQRCPTTIVSKMAPSDGGQLIWPGIGLRHMGAWATFGAGPQAFTVVGTHYRWPEPLANQREQSQRLAMVLTRFDGPNLIVAGDFNLTPWSFRLRRQDASFGLARLTHAIFTFPAGQIAHWGMTFPFPLLPIDQIYAGSNWRPVSVARGQAVGSDHYPIVAVLTRQLPASR